MCNPPFYSSIEDMESSASLKDSVAHSVCSGSHGEMITEGGEVGFVKQLLNDSLLFQTNVSWYSSLHGKLYSVRIIVESFKNLNIDNYTVTEFIQGNTKRWAVAWSFLPLRLPDVSYLLII